MSVLRAENSSNPSLALRGFNTRAIFRTCAALLSICTVVGCGAPVAFYSSNLAYIRKNETEETRFTAQQKRDVTTILEAMFGTPDAPFLPTGGETGITEVVRPELLSLAAGPVATDEQGRPTGLYRQHCGHCHGTTGNGLGPTAPFLNPYPRDYRKGSYKFKSTPIGTRPTHDDLKRVILNGIQGTAMPSFKLLPDVEVEALVNYVKFLGIRGEVERALIEETKELEEGERLIDPENPAALNAFVIDEVLAETVAKWRDASVGITPIPKRPTMNAVEHLASVRRGKDLFYGAVANCVKCHGESQLGDGQTTDYDEWAKDFFDWSQTGDKKVWEQKRAEYEVLTQLKLRNILPRNLRQGVYRGGNRPVDIFWRIHNGIEGSPMPAAMLRPEGAPPDAKGLSPNDIWDIVNYVQSLPFEVTSFHGETEPTYQRARQ